MKKKLTIIGLLGFTFLFGCNVQDDNVKADNYGDMNVISIDEVHRGDSVILKHSKTGCYYLYVRGNGSSTSSSPTQMLDKDGLPYCD